MSSPEFNIELVKSLRNQLVGEANAKIRKISPAKVNNLLEDEVVEEIDLMRTQPQQSHGSGC